MAAMKPKQPGEERFIQRTLPHHSHQKRKPGQELEAGANAEATEGAVYWLAQCALLRTPGPPSQGWHHLPWENALEACPQSDLMEALFQIEAPSSQMI